MSFYTELQVRYTDFDTIDLSTEKQNSRNINGGFNPRRCLW